MQDPNENTDWNDVLREKGVLPPKQEKEISETDIIDILEDTVMEKTSGRKKLEDCSLDELDLVEDEEDEKVLFEYRKKRMDEIKAQAAKNKYGEVREISGVDYIEQVNNAGADVWVILHLYKPGVPLCTVINNYFHQLAKKFPSVKFLNSVSDTCIANYPDRNLPTIFVYFDGNMTSKFVGADEVGGMNVKLEELEWMLAEAGAVKTDLECNPRKKIKDVLFTQLKDNDDGNDW